MGLFNLFSKPSEPVPSTPQSKGNVLLVDDEQILINFYNSLLTREGYTVIIARNGQEAIEAVQKQRPDIMLLDIMMPVMNGIEVLRILWENESTRTIPVIVLTNAGDLDNMDQAKFYSAFKFFVKSNVSDPELLQAITEGVSLSKQQIKTTEVKPQTP